MTWLLTDRTSRPEFESVFRRRAEFAKAYVDFYASVLALSDPIIIELCRLRMAKLIGSQLDLSLRYLPAVAAGLTEAKIAVLADWHTSPMYSPKERACLAFAELFTIDSSEIGDADVDQLLQEATVDEFQWLTLALGRMDSFQRICATLQLEPSDEVPQQLREWFTARPTTSEHSSTT